MMTYNRYFLDFCAIGRATYKRTFYWTRIVGPIKSLKGAIYPQGPKAAAPPSVMLYVHTDSRSNGRVGTGESSGLGERGGGARPRVSAVTLCA